MVLSSASNTVTNLAYLPAGAHPVAMVETLVGSDLYVLNQGNNTVADLPLDLTTIATIPVASPRSGLFHARIARGYTSDSGNASQSSQLYTINTASDAVIPSQSVGIAGANFVYDKSRNPFM
jgi:hypothetical protein